MSKSKETPGQIIKRLEKELVDEKLKHKVLNTMIDISDSQYETQIIKKFLPNHQTHPTRTRRKPIQNL